MVQRLQSITEAALAPRSLDQLVRGVAERIHEVVEADTTVILLPTDDGRDLEVAHAIGLTARAADTVRVPIGEGVTGRIAASGQPLTTAVAGAREAYFAELGDVTPCTVYDRARLEPDRTFEGPAIVEQLDSTTVVLPGQMVRVDRYGNLILEWLAGNGEAR